jgi:hypothetical protein
MKSAGLRRDAMEDLLLRLTRGNVSEVKIVLTTVCAALALYQVALIAVGYGKVKLPFLGPLVAGRAHRAIGDSIVVVAMTVAAMCIVWFGFEDDAALHIAFAIALLAVLAFKIAVIRRLRQFDRLLPALGISVLLLFWATWFSAAAEHVL